MAKLKLYTVKVGKAKFLVSGVSKSNGIQNFREHYPEHSAEDHTRIRRTCEEDITGPLCIGTEAVNPAASQVV